MTAKLNTISFVASLPPIQSAISVSGDHQGARIKLDIPETHADVVPLIQLYLSGRPFVVHIDLEEQSTVPRSA